MRALRTPATRVDPAGVVRNSIGCSAYLRRADDVALTTAHSLDGSHQSLFQPHFSGVVIHNYERVLLVRYGARSEYWKRVDAVLMGRKTWQQAVAQGNGGT